MSKTVLIIGYVWPEPNSSAAGAHMLSLLRFYKKQSWKVVFATPAQKTDHMIDLSTEDIESVEILLNDSSFDLFVEDLAPDVVMFDRFMMEEQFGWRVQQRCPNALRILDTEDLQCLRYARQNALKQKREMQQTDLLSDLAKREIAAIMRSDLSLIISDYEIELLQKVFKVDPQLLHHLPFLIEQSCKPVHKLPFGERKHFMTIGNFRHAPNWDSVLYLQQIWPLIRAQIPDAELHIYGSYPPKKATALHNAKTGFLIKGWAEDAFHVLSEARVCLAPLRFGAGIKGKLIDAMRVGTPSVTTSIGAEGMTGHLPWPGIIADDVEDIVDSAVNLYRNQEFWELSQSHIAPILSERYNSDRLSLSLTARLDHLQNNLEQHRLDNFVGAMLDHHTMKSTQFMSKWIEAKSQLKAQEIRD